MKNLAAHTKLVSEYKNIPEVQAINPASVLRNLLGNLNMGRDILYLLTIIIVFMAAIVIYVTTTSYVEDSKRHLGDALGGHKKEDHLIALYSTDSIHFCFKYGDFVLDKLCQPFSH